MSDTETMITPDEFFCQRFADLYESLTKNHNLSRKDVCSLIGVSHGTLDNWRYGRTCPSGEDNEFRKKAESLFAQHEIELPTEHRKLAASSGRKPKKAKRKSDDQPRQSAKTIRLKIGGAKSSSVGTLEGTFGGKDGFEGVLTLNKTQAMALMQELLRKCV